MKVSGLVSACLVAAVSVPTMAQEGPNSGSNRAGMEVTELVTRYAKSAGRPFTVDPRANSTVLLAGIDAAALSHAQFLAILDMHQLAVIDAGDMLAVVPDAEGRQFPTPIYSDGGFKALDHELVTLLVHPKNVCAAFLVPVLRPLMPQAAHLAAEIQTNMLIINDRAANARRIAKVVEQLDLRGPGTKECPGAAGAATR